MNYIALTGRDRQAMARAAEYLLTLVTEQQLAVAIMLHVNDVRAVTTLKVRASPYGVGELWRIGVDPERRLLHHLVDRHVLAIPADREAFELQLRQGLHELRPRLSPPLSHHHSPTMENP